MSRNSVPVRTTCPACETVVQISSTDLLRNPDILVSCPGCHHEFPLSLRSRTIPKDEGREQPARATVRPVKIPLDELTLVEPMPSSGRSDADPPHRRTRRAAAAPVRENVPPDVSPPPPFVTLERDSSTSHPSSQILPPFAPSGAGRPGPSDTPVPPPIPAAAPTFAPVARSRRSLKERWNALSSGQQTWLVAGPLIVVVGVIVFFFLPLGEIGAPPPKARRGDPPSNKSAPEPDKAPAPDKKDGPPPVPLLLEDPPAGAEKQPGSGEKAPAEPKEIPAPEPGKTPKPEGDDSTRVPPPRG
jgi:hypothetical protein